MLPYAFFFEYCFFLTQKSSRRSTTTEKFQNCFASQLCVVPGATELTASYFYALFSAADVKIELTGHKAHVQ